MSELAFIDAHMHAWDLRRLRYAWLTPPFLPDGPNGDVSPIAKDYSLADYRAEARAWSVIGAVHVQAGADDGDALAETDWLEAEAERTGLPLAIISFAALDHPNLDALLAAHAQRPRVRGIRHIVNWHADPRRTYTPRDVTQDEAWAKGYARLKDHGLSFDLQAYPGQFAALARLIARHPETPVMLNHAGMGVDDVESWRNGMRALAALPHVAVKISGMGFVFKPWDRDKARDRVRATIDMFGADRAMFASDFPTDRLFASFNETISTLQDAVSDFGLEERKALFAGNSNRLYRMGLAV